MKLIVGLGNPGNVYIDTRHNIGFSVVKALARFYKVVFKKDRNFLSTKVKIANKNVILALPLTFMNLSGVAVRTLLKEYKIDLKDLLVVCDDLDLEFGRLRLRVSGSSGGHRGLESIIDSLSSKDFNRLRIGIGRPQKSIDTKDYVLSKFSKEEKRRMKGVIEAAVQCCQTWVIEGASRAMAIFNQKESVK